MLAVAAMLLILAALCAAAFGAGLVLGERGEPLRGWLATQLHGRPPEQPTGRPIEAIAVDLHRLSRQFHTLHPHASYAKVVAVQSAYDRTLAECCAALGLTQLLVVLPPGPELDAERTRVEDQLTGCGVRLPHAA